MVRKRFVQMQYFSLNIFDPELAESPEDPTDQLCSAVLSRRGERKEDHDPEEMNGVESPVNVPTDILGPSCQYCQEPGCLKQAWVNLIKHRVEDEENVTEQPGVVAHACNPNYLGG
jgi:hypothetical protein